MAINFLPEHAALVQKRPVAQAKGSGRIKLLPEHESILRGEAPAPAPTPVQPPTPPAPAPVAAPSLFQRAKESVAPVVEAVNNFAEKNQMYSGGKLKQPQMKAPVGEGMTPEEKIVAEQSIRVGNQADPIVSVYEDIKIPFIDAGVTYNKNNSIPGLTPMVKSIIEAPEKAVRTFTEPAGLTKWTDERGGDPLYQTASYGEKATKLSQSFLDKGYSYSTSVLLGAGLVGLEASGDALFFSSLLKGGAAKATGQAAGKISTEEVRTAYEFLGKPKTMAEAEARWRQLQIQFHPDKNGGNDIISKQLNQAMAILRREGIPNEGMFAGMVDRRPVKKVETKLIGDRPVEVPPPVQAVVPEPTPAPKPRTLTFDELPDYAKGGIQSDLRVKVTNEGASTDLIKNLRNTKYTEEVLNIADLQKTNPDVFLDTFTKRGSVSKGPIVVNANGEVIDGNNRLREAFDRGETTIVAYKPKPDTINLVPENIVETSKKEGLDYDPMKQIKMSDGEIVKRPETIVSRTQLQSLIKTLEKDEIILKVAEQPETDRVSYNSDKTYETGRQEKILVYEEPGKRNIVIKAKALGLVTDRLPVGGQVKVTRAALGVKGTAKDTVFRGVDDDGNVVAKEYTQAKTDITPASSPAELKYRVQQLNKVAQQQAILRKAGGAPKNASGVFKTGPKFPKQGQINLQKGTLLNDRQYMSTLAHELGHALEKSITNEVNKSTHKVFGKNITKAEWKTIRDELEAVTRDMEGDSAVDAKPQYYLQNTELLARFIEKQFSSPGNLNDLAPTAVEFFKKSTIDNPIINDYIDALKGNIDKGELKWIPFRDMKETYQKYLGKKLGTMAWNDEVLLRSMTERAKVEIENLLENKFKNVKDDPALLFRAVESIKVTKGGEPEFGTRKFLYVDDMSEALALEDEGYKVLRDGTGEPVLEVVKGKTKIRIVKDRYTAEQGKKFFEELSPEGKQLVKDFTAAREEAKDYFNREIIKDKHKIEGSIEGWVHHIWPDETTLLGNPSNKLKLKTADSRKMRTEQEGYIEDLRLSMEKMMKDINVEAAYNDHIGTFLARVTQPYTEGMEIPKGWIVVEGDIAKGGVARQGQNKFKIMKPDGEMITGAKSQYIMPDRVYRRYELVKETAREMSDVMKVFNSLNRYWKVNILFHLGSTATNLFSGAIQYSSKIMTDFYEELLTGSVKTPQTRANIEALLLAIRPKGWNNSPDWIYGGDMSNQYGQFLSTNAPGLGVNKLDRAVDFYGDRVLKTYGMAERYWKKVITLAEGGTKLDRLKMGPKGLELPTKEEKELLAAINEQADLYAYDYDNVPVQLEEWSRSPMGSMVTPFLKYPYKNFKQVSQMAERVFDRTLPYQERLSGLLTLTTIAAAYAYFRKMRREEQKTPEVPDSAPASMSTRGRLFIETDENGKEVFTRVSKYPFINMTEAGLQYYEGNTRQSWEMIEDMLGSFGPMAEAALALTGWSTKYNTHVPLEARMGKLLGSYMPGSRILYDMARFEDPYQRVQDTFFQGIASNVPLPYDEEVFKKLRGNIRTVPVPIEGDVDNPHEEGSRRTTVDRPVLNYKEDILYGALLGLLRTRIDPKEAEAFVIRKEKNLEKKQAKEE